MAVERRLEGLSLPDRRLAESGRARVVPDGSIRLDPGLPAPPLALQVEFEGVAPGVR